jgi:hypothetical protein
MVPKVRAAGGELAHCDRKLLLIWLGLLYGLEADFSNSRSAARGGSRREFHSGKAERERSHLLGQRLPFPGTYLYVSHSHNCRWANAETHVETHAGGAAAARPALRKTGSGEAINKIPGNAEPRAHFKRPRRVRPRGQRQADCGFREDREQTPHWTPAIRLRPRDTQVLRKKF